VAICGISHRKGYGLPLLTKEALDFLALRPGAGPTEIKEAYRDLVKVWHPDRFGSDPRLRQKAEDKLKQLNEAYRVLQSDPVADSSRDDTPSAGNASSAPRTRKRQARWNRNAVGVGWIYGFLGIALGCLAGYLVLEHRAMQRARPTLVSAQQAADPSQQAAPGSSTQTPEEVLAGPNVRPARASGNVEAKEAGDSHHGNSAQYRVFSLSDTQTSEMESACSSQKEAHGQAAYQACVKAQLDLITNASSAPDLSALSAAERESIESVCSEVKRHRGADAYNQCLNAQMAALAAEPSRPDLSALNDVDRSSIESACRNPKYRDGPSAYDRCLLRFIKLLAESK
jgi:hypothetical protein